ncbi:hypothetical protein CH333_00660 [candidate division WOR-3 bacterium JGI_Cruoil_03_44_89]|uniref:Glycosidase n=1 Tax=candidate division WOR-3 bacterium JGI_Cruoil_03_44_89 TaxID=1973748 RepID=A0A235BYT7_UNCW3|nr:MAG: hypothetical protein CH333_00660 [candidate division WOR-3 bacterium JGI_Cruoil_03_44_89]
MKINTKNLGDGMTASLPSGEVIFKLDSCKDNPILRPRDIGLTWQEDGVKKVGAVFNGGGEVFNERVILAPRCHKNYREGKFVDERTGTERKCLENYISEIWLFESENGMHFKRLNTTMIRGDGTSHKDFVYGIEDIRIVRYEDMYLLVGCGKVAPPFQGKNADRIAIHSTKDFVDISYHGMVDAFDSRNAIPFPEYIGGKLYIFLRMYPNIQIAPLVGGVEQLLFPVKHREYWEGIYTNRDKHRLFHVGNFPHEREKIGPGTQPIKTERGWLFIYHAVGEIGGELSTSYGVETPIKRGYSICAALLDTDNPRRVLCRTRKPIYIPNAPYELFGNEEYPVDVPYVVFPTGAVVCGEKLLIYAGVGDKYEILLSCNINKLVEYLWKYCRS